MKLLPIMAILLCALSACTLEIPIDIEEPVDTTKSDLEQKVPKVPGEILYEDVFANQVPADQMSIFGVQLGDTKEDIEKIHGEPDIQTRYTQRFQNLEYFLGSNNTTAVLYHLEDDVVKGALLTQFINDHVPGDIVPGIGLEEMYGALGQPTTLKILELQQVYVYNELGYEYYVRRKQVQRIFVTTPDRGITRPGEGEEQQDCKRVITHAMSPKGDCVHFPTTCSVPDDWEVVDFCEEEQEERACPEVRISAVHPASNKCRVFETICDVPESWEEVNSCDDPQTENNAPVFCIQVIQPAIDPDTDECKEFPTPCDVPEGWETVDQCPQ